MKHFDELTQCSRDIYIQQKVGYLYSYYLPPQDKNLQTLTCNFGTEILKISDNIRHICLSLFTPFHK
jgi:hypothetical protein